MNKINTKEEYGKVKEQVEFLINEATAKGMLEPEMDNEYTQKISELSKLMAEYEDNALNLNTLRIKNPLVQSIEDYSYTHNMKQKELAVILGINESVFSQIMNGKRKVTMSVAKKIHKILGIDGNIILQFS